MIYVNFDKYGVLNHIEYNDEVIFKGNNNVNKVFVCFDGIELKPQHYLTYSALINDKDYSGNLTDLASIRTTYNGKDGYMFSIFSNLTKDAGTLKLSVRLVDRLTDSILVSGILPLIVQDSAVSTYSNVNITTTQYQALLTAVDEIGNKIIESNFKTINGENVLGGGSINLPTFDDVNLIKTNLETNLNEQETKIGTLENKDKAQDASINEINGDITELKNKTNNNLSKIDEINGKLVNKADLQNGKIPSSQLPSFVDDVIEYATFNDFAISGENGKIYIDKSTNKTYRWSGSQYVEISPSLVLGETSSTAFAGDRGKNLEQELINVKANIETLEQEKANKTNVLSLEENKQDKLISGNNIKTINGESILGVGNIEIKSSSSQNVEIEDVIDDEKTIRILYLPHMLNDAVESIPAINIFRFTKPVKLVWSKAMTNHSVKFKGKERKSPSAPFNDFRIYDKLSLLNILGIFGFRPTDTTDMYSWEFGSLNRDDWNHIDLKYIAMGNRTKNVDDDISINRFENVGMTEKKYVDNKLSFGLQFEIIDKDYYNFLGTLLSLRDFTLPELSLFTDPSNITKKFQKKVRRNYIKRYYENMSMSFATKGEDLDIEYAITSRWENIYLKPYYNIGDETNENWVMASHGIRLSFIPLITDANGDNCYIGWGYDSELTSNQNFMILLNWEKFRIE